MKAFGTKKFSSFFRRNCFLFLVTISIKTETDVCEHLSFAGHEKFGQWPADVAADADAATAATDRWDKWHAVKDNKDL